MNAEDIIGKKRDSGELTRDEIQFIVDGISNDTLQDDQVSEFLKATHDKGMTVAETVALTKAMHASAPTLKTSEVRGTKVDMHSIAATGDKTGIILAPLMATMGFNVPMVTGRSLGSTLDKLNCIPGFRVDLSDDEAIEQLRDLGVFITDRSSNIASVDRKMFALRELTGTIDSIPLIVSSVISNKLAGGAEGLILDVKMGSGGLMKDEESAHELAHMLVEVGKAVGLRTVAVITDLSAPLGSTVGSMLELKECITALRGKGSRDLREVILTIATWSLFLADSISEDFDLVKLKGFNKDKYMNEAEEFIVKGDAYKKFLEMVDAQGGDLDTILKPTTLPRADNVMQITAGESGNLRRMDAAGINKAAAMLGAVKVNADDEIDPAAGIIINQKPGKEVDKDDIIAMFHYNDDTRLKDAEEIFRSALEISKRDRAMPRLINDVIF